MSAEVAAVQTGFSGAQAELRSVRYRGAMSGVRFTLFQGPDSESVASTKFSVDAILGDLPCACRDKSDY